MDNKSAHMAVEYDSKVKATIPNYEMFHTETLDLIKNLNEYPQRWLDTGCGTGTLAIKAARIFKSTEFVLADPSQAMLDIAMEKTETLEDAKLRILKPAASQEISLPEGSFDVITAIQSHHYLDIENRKSATANCFRMLKPGGVYVTFENIRPFSNKGIETGLRRWAEFQIRGGKSRDEAEKHVGRFGKEFYPITITEHIDVLKEAGFKTVELLYSAYMQAGFYAIKG